MSAKGLARLVNHKVVEWAAVVMMSPSEGRLVDLMAEIGKVAFRQREVSLKVGHR